LLVILGEDHTSIIVIAGLDLAIGRDIRDRAAVGA
jgi:hypothetical protein